MDSGEIMTAIADAAPQARMWWYASTPGGSLIVDTGHKTRDGCIAKLLQVGAHMPYGTWANFEKRGYTLSQLPVKP